MEPLPLPRPVPVFTGGLITLRPADPGRDAQAHHALCQDAPLTARVGDRVPASAAEALRELRRLSQLAAISLRLIGARAAGQVMGRSFLDRSRAGEDLVAGGGVRIASSHWRTG